MDYDRLASRLARCGEYLVFRHYFTVGKVRLHQAEFCKIHLLCPLCAIRRGAKMLKAYLDRYAVIRAQHPGLSAFLVTLTVKDGGDLRERLEHLQEGVKRLQGRRWDAARGRNRRTQMGRVVAAVGSYEVKLGRGSGLWHPHLHMVALCSGRISQRALVEEWRAITGDSYILDVCPFHRDQEPAEAFMEVCKYAVKVSELDPARTLEAFQALRGRRLIFSLGLFRGVKIPVELADEPLDGLPYIELFYRYLAGSGYALEAYGQAGCLPQSRDGCETSHPDLGIPMLP